MEKVTQKSDLWRHKNEGYQGYNTISTVKLRMHHPASKGSVFELEGMKGKNSL